MLSFRSLFIAAAAFATLASAIPTNAGPLGVADGLTPGKGLTGKIPAGGLVAAPNVAGLPMTDAEVNKILGRLDLTTGRIFGAGATGNTLNQVVSSLRRRGGEKVPVGDLFQSCHDKIEPIFVKIEAAVKVEGAVEIVVGLLGEIVIILKDLLAELKLVAVIELTLAGVVCTVRELAVVIAALLILVIKVIWIVVFVLGYVEGALVDVIVVIGGLLCEILKILFVLLIELKVELAILLGGYGRDCGFIHYTDILVLLGIKL